jgi:hypothetical protein
VRVPHPMDGSPVFSFESDVESQRVSRLIAGDKQRRTSATHEHTDRYV